jgi:release factor glutamine methyltransferase
MNEAELLFTEVFNCDRMSLYQNYHLRLSNKKALRICAVLKRRIQGEPIQYILGKTEFMGLELKVTPDIFIPRPETEILVETALRIVRSFAHSPRQKLKILDIGTGSGCIAISLAKLLLDIDAHIIATDISEEALKVAYENAVLNNVSDRIKFIKSDLFTNYQLSIINYDIIISNPPYIMSQEIKNLPAEISYEPRISLDGGKDGLDFYRRIISEVVPYLRKQGFLLLEIGFQQKNAIESIFHKSKNFKVQEVIRDYNDIERVILAKRIK